MMVRIRSEKYVVVEMTEDQACLLVEILLMVSRNEETYNFIEPAEFEEVNNFVKSVGDVIS